MDPLRPAVSILLALWAPLPSSRGPAVVQGPDAVHEVLDDADGPGRLSLEAWLSTTRPLARCAAVLPGPELALPAAAGVREAGEGVLVECGAASAMAGRRLLLSPEPAGAGARWRVEGLAAMPAPFDPVQARRDVHVATERAIEALTELDLARERPELAEALTDLVVAGLDPRLVPPSLPPRRRDLLERSLRLGAICELALADDGAAVTAGQAVRRRRALEPLAGAARRGVGAATQTWAR